MSKKLKIIIGTLILILIAGGFTYNYVMHGGERNLESEDTEFKVTSVAIINEFTTNTELANKKYLEKAIAVSGKVTDVQPNQIIIDNVVICNFKSAATPISKDQSITVKGRVVGFDDLMGELKLDKCFTEN